MKDIDWSEAPDGATHKHGREWGKKVDGIWYFCSHSFPNWTECASQHNVIFERPLGTHTRPHEPTQWKGPQDGFPPVGTEVKYPSGQGVVKLKADLDGVIIVEEYGLYKRVAGDACSPIQSERDKLLVMAVEVCQSSFKVEAIEDISRMLYDAGMLVDPERKPMSRSEADSILVKTFRGWDHTPTTSRDSILDALGYKD